MKIVIIVPTYNEKENIAKLIPLLEEEVLPKIKQHSTQILVVDDTSPDGTADVVKKLMNKWKNIELLTGEKKGLGAAYVRGMRYAIDKLAADAVMEFDADFQHDPYDIPRLIRAMDDGADYVIGSRYIPGGKIPKEWGLDRKFLSVFGNLFTRTAWLNYTIHDITSGFKLTKTSFLKAVDFDHLSNHFTYKMQILHDVVKQGAKVKEVPIVFYEREKGSSKISKKDQFDSLYIVLRLGIKDKRRFLQFLVVGGTGFIVQIILQEFSYFSGFAAFLIPVIFPVVSLFTHTVHTVALENGIAAAIGAESAIIANFSLNNAWTFKDRAQKHQNSHVLIRGIKFNLTSFISVIIQFLAIAFSVMVFGNTVNILSHPLPTRDIVLFPTIIFLIIPLNYFIYNKVIWKHKPKPA